MRTLERTYGIVVYLLFLAVFLYCIGFVEGVLVPRSVHGPVPEGAGGTKDVLINVGILGLFAVQHTIMARRGFKAWWTKLISPAVERSTFVLATLAILTLLFFQWRPLPGVIWDVTSPTWRAVIWGFAAAGWGLVLLATFLIDHFALFGLRQSWTGVDVVTGTGFVTPAIYRWTRHPLYLGFIAAFWFTPTMTGGGLMFAAICTVYVVAIGIQFEERDLVAQFGERYRSYRRSTPMLIPVPGRAAKEPTSAPARTQR